MTRIIAFDYGTKRIGVAVSDDSKIIASSLPVLINDFSFDQKIMKIIVKYSPIEKAIIGWNQNSKHNEEVLNLKTFLEKINIDVEFCDESYSTSDSSEELLQFSIKSSKRKKIIDSHVARNLLQKYLDGYSIK